ncbi:uncharacterized protein [Palaemon carinicauda]|uniref:uncharacterized protein isoform X2 n=1 Tax=Palaemon carinicauda TaxID=392227 RepID=UPI0035B59A72
MGKLPYFNHLEWKKKRFKEERQHTDMISLRLQVVMLVALMAVAASVSASPSPDEKHNDVRHSRTLGDPYVLSREKRSLRLGAIVNDGVVLGGFGGPLDGLGCLYGCLGIKYHGYGRGLGRFFGGDFRRRRPPFLSENFGHRPFGFGK